MSSKVSYFSFEYARANCRESRVTEVLTGLGKGEFGFLIGPPGLGKTNISLSIAYEVTTGDNFLALIPDRAAPRKVLFIPFEDKEFNMNSKLLSHSENFTSDQKRKIESNLAYYCDYSPLVPLLHQEMNNNHILDLIDAAKDFDLLIIDTARSALGGWDDVKGDSLFRYALSEIARKADVAVLVNHHLTKQQAIRYEDVNATGGSGLSATQSESKYHLFLHSESGKKNRLLLKHSKANYVPMDKLRSSENPIVVSKLGYLLFNEEVFRAAKPDSVLPERIAKKTTTKQVTPKVELGDLVVPFDEVDLNFTKSKDINPEPAEEQFLDKMFTKPGSK